MTDDFLQLQGKCAIVTGAARGIGKGIARRFRDLGVQVAIWDINEAAGRETANEISSSFFKVDVTDASSVRAGVENMVSDLGSLDFVINNAAPARNREFIGSLDRQDWSPHASMVVEAVTTIFEASRAHLAKSQGAVVNISSATGQSIAPEQCSWSYHASKAALDHLTRYLAGKYGPEGIRTNAVAPALVDRDQSPRLSDNERLRRVAELTVPLGRPASSQDIANVVAFLCSDLASYVNGQVITVDGGLGNSEVFGAALRVGNDMNKA